MSKTGIHHHLGDFKWTPLSFNRSITYKKYYPVGDHVILKFSRELFELITVKAVTFPYRNASYTYFCIFRPDSIWREGIYVVYSYVSLKDTSKIVNTHIAPIKRALYLVKLFFLKNSI